MTEANSTDASRGPRVSTIELCDELWGVHVSFVDPGVLFAAVTFPSDEELKSISEYATVED